MDAAGGKAGDGGLPKGASRWSLQAMMETILGNLQLVVTNVHVRYEDDVAWAGHALALGLLLNRLAAQTVDEQGRPAWVPGSMRQLLRKVRHASVSRNSPMSYTYTEHFMYAGMIGL